jgi:CIC family chloride channel protein
VVAAVIVGEREGGEAGPAERESHGGVATEAEGFGHGGIALGEGTFEVGKAEVRGLQQGRDVDMMQSITVAEAMTTPAPAIVETASLEELRQRFRFYNTRSLCVVDGEGLLAGIVTLTDLQEAYETGQYEDRCVGDICTRDVVTANPGDTLWRAIRTMGVRSIGRLPVVKPGTRELQGMLRRHDIVRAYNLGISRKRDRQHIAEEIRLNNLADAHVFQVIVALNSPVAGKHIQDIHWPKDSIVASIRRHGRLIVPHGNTRLQPGDTLIVVAAFESESDLAALMTALPPNP